MKQCAFWGSGLLCGAHIPSWSKPWRCFARTGHWLIGRSQSSGSIFPRALGAGYYVVLVGGLSRQIGFRGKSTWSCPLPRVSWRMRGVAWTPFISLWRNWNPHFCSPYRQILLLGRSERAVECRSSRPHCSHGLRCVGKGPPDPLIEQALSPTAHRRDLPPRRAVPGDKCHPRAVPGLRPRPDGARRAEVWAGVPVGGAALPGRNQPDSQPETRLAANLKIEPERAAHSLQVNC
jgi:hypothetical protein